MKKNSSNVLILNTTIYEVTNTMLRYWNKVTLVVNIIFLKYSETS